MKGFFVTGTDTGVGKTFVSCGLARLAVSRRQRVFAFKPVETGDGDDRDQLVTAAGSWQTGALHTLYRFAMPAAPLVAAEAEGSSVDLDRILRVVRDGATGADLVLVEGAGGLRVPLTATLDMAGLARAVGLPLLIAARAGLGTINHSLLTIEAAEGEGLEIAALVLSQRPEDSAEVTRSNAEQIERRWPGKVRVVGPTFDALAGLLRG